MQYIKKFKLDFNAEKPMFTIPAKQLDVGSRFLLIEPTLDDEKIDVRDNTISFRAIKPNGTRVISECVCNAEGNIEVELTAQALSTVGVLRCELQLNQDGVILSSCPFCINVIKSIDDGVEDSSPISILQGTTLTVHLTLYDNDDNIYKLTADDKIIFGVKRYFTDSNYIIKKIFTSDAESDDGYNIELFPEDTQIAVGTYMYDIGVQVGSDYYIAVKPNIFTVEPAVTSKE